MKQKRTAAAVLILAVGIGLFAQNAEYKALLAKAKEYESKKQFVYALGTYYDAVEAEPTNASKEAQDAFSALSNAIKDGNPGYGNFDEFEIYDNWVLFLKEYEKYWTENSPRAFLFSPLKRDSIDRATKTGNYKTDIIWDWSVKYKYISQAVFAGLKKSRQNDWTGIPENWPNVSVYNAEFKEKNYLKNGVALLQQYKIYHPYEKETQLCPAALIESVGSFDDFGNGFFYYTSMNDLKINVIDTNGKILLKSPRIFFITEYEDNTITYMFKGVDQATMKLIDGGKTKTVLDSVFLAYGSPPNLSATLDRSWVNKLPEVTLDTNKTVFGTDTDPFIKIQLLNSFVTVEGGEFKMGNEEGKDDEKPVHTVHLDTFEMMESEITESLYEHIMNFKKASSNSQQNPKSFEFIMAILFCNKLSELTQRTPCYNIVDIDKADIICNFEANGYRLPTEAEWEYAARGGKHHSSFKHSGSDNFADVGIKKSGNVKSKAPNALGIYDMSGNALEWCWDWYSQYSAEEVTNPAINKKGEDNKRIIRGFCYEPSGGVDNNYPSVTRRFADNPVRSARRGIGLRIVRSVR